MKKTYTPDKDDRYFSRAVCNALKILDLLRAEPTPLGLSEKGGSRLVPRKI